MGKNWKSFETPLILTRNSDGYVIKKLLCASNVKDAVLDTSDIEDSTYLDITDSN